MHFSHESDIKPYSIRTNLEDKLSNLTDRMQGVYYDFFVLFPIDKCKRKWMGNGAYTNHVYTFEMIIFHMKGHTNIFSAIESIE